MKMKKFVIHWLDGKTEEIEGYDISDAFRRAGYGGGAIRAVDFFENVKEKSNKQVSVISE